MESSVSGHLVDADEMHAGTLRHEQLPLPLVRCVRSSHRLTQMAQDRCTGSGNPPGEREPLTESPRPPSPDHPLTGSCLCGGVRFEVTAEFRRANYCHCSRCRKHSGAAALAQARVSRTAFRLLQGADLIETYRPATGMAKAFCRICGSSLFGGTWPVGPEVSIRLGALDGDPCIRPQYHSFVDSRAAWESMPDDGLDRFQGPAPRQTVDSPLTAEE